MQHASEKCEMSAELSENLKSRDFVQYFGADERVILRWIFQKCGVEMSIGLCRFALGSDNGLL
jgi:hypothetical protein